MAKTILLCSRRAVARFTYAITVCGFMAMAPVSMVFGGLVLLQFAQRHARSQEGQVMIGLPRERLPVAGQGLILLAVLRVVLTEQVMIGRGRGMQRLGSCAGLGGRLLVADRFPAVGHPEDHCGDRRMEALDLPQGLDCPVVPGGALGCGLWRVALAHLQPRPDEEEFDRSFVEHRLTLGVEDLEGRLRFPGFGLEHSEQIEGRAAMRLGLIEDVAVQRVHLGMDALT